MHLENYISELLLRHNCLIIPGFGGFVARYSPAKIDWNKGVIAPPSKELLFNKHLIQSDGLFINHIALAKKLSFPDASKLIENEVASWTDLLRSGGRVEIEKVGLLYHDFDGNIIFEQDRFFNLLLSSFGLKEVSFVAETAAIQEENVELVTENVDPIEYKAPVFAIVNQSNTLEEPKKSQQPPIVPIQPVAKSRFNWKYLAAAALIPFGFFAYWIPMKTDVLHSGKVAIADFNPFRSIPSISYSTEKINKAVVEEELHYSWEELTKDLPKEIEVFNYRFSEDLYIPVRLIEKDKTDVTKDVILTVSSPNTVSSTQNHYFLIAGCFGNKNNADNLVSDLKSKGYEASILDVHKGLHRVSIAGFSDHSFATTEMSALANQGISTWILKK